jgi:hypothetical protein
MSSSEWESETVTSLKIGFPPKEKKIINNYNHSTSTSYSSIKVGD